MEVNAKSHRSATTPLLPVSYSPLNESNLCVSKPFKSQCSTPKLILLHRILLLTLGTFTLLCIFMSTSTLVPQAPKIRLNSLFMSKLKVSNTMLQSDWDLKLTIENPNLVSWVSFDRVEGSILYKDNTLAIKSVEPFVLGLKERRIVHMKISTTGLEEDQPVVKDWVIGEIREKRKDGAVQFSMQMFIWGTYKNGWWGTQKVVMNPQCSDIKVGVLPKFGFGSWVSRSPMTCSVPMLNN